ncbi:MAG: flagellin FliC [Rhodocyclaceae bacterium]|nr:flagellin FliC [Rhodocyclaceae bacterium]
MAAIINTNIQSLNAQRNLSMTQTSLATSLQRLSSGLRVNSAKDDAAGLAIATRMTAQSRGMTVAIRNANDAISLTQTAEGALGQIKDHLLRMRDIAVQSASHTNPTSERASLEAEYDQLQAEISRIGQQTTFNGLKILDSNAGAQTFQIGANGGETISVTTTAISGGAVSSATAAASTVSSAGGASAAIATIDAAIDKVNTDRATYGAAQVRFEGVVSMLQISRENQEAAASRIMDADFAAETASLTRAQILQQAGTAMLAQANALPQNVLSLLG